MQARYLGRIAFTQALRVQAASEERARRGESGVLLGFESEPVVTLGVRGDPSKDLLCAPADLRALGFDVVTIDRGGQATLHNPGQLVLFPVVRFAPRFSARVWVDHLVRVTQEMGRALGVELTWRAEAPGLYTPEGKVVAFGLRLRQGISTHGLAINLSNTLADFSLIRACGERHASVAHLGRGHSPREVFALWSQVYTELTLERFSQSLEPHSKCAPSSVG